MPARADQPAEKKTLGDSEQALEECTALEADLAELKANYDQFFIGIERVPPSKKHDLIKRRMATLKGLFIRQTAVKFRVQAVAAKLVTYERLWDRTLKEIEAGTYKRDLFKVKLHAQKRKPEGAKTEQPHFDEDLDLSDLDDTSDDLESALSALSSPMSLPELPKVQPVTAPTIKPVTADFPIIKPVTGDRPIIKPVTGVVPVITPVITGANPAFKPGTPPTGTGSNPALRPTVTGSNPALRPAVTGSNPALKPASPTTPSVRPAVTGSNPALKPAMSPPRPPVDTSDGLSDQKIKAIYEAYVMAKKRCGEDTRSLTLDSVSSSLKKQVPALMKQHNARSVEFKVVIKDGKAVLRALPKDS